MPTTRVMSSCTAFSLLRSILLNSAPQLKFVRHSERFSCFGLPTSIWFLLLPTKLGYMSLLTALTGSFLAVEPFPFPFEEYALCFPSYNFIIDICQFSFNFIYSFPVFAILHDYCILLIFLRKPY